MRLAISVLAAALLSTPGRGQGTLPKPVEIADEPHHVLLLQNSSVRVFSLKLKPNEATLPHSHRKFYAYISLRPVEISNEVRGRKPVIAHLGAGELHTAKGGFTLAERNNSPDPSEVLVIEAMKPDVEEFKRPMRGSHYHGALFGVLFEDFEMRGYSMIVAAGASTEHHEEKYDRLIVAVSSLELLENVAGQPPLALTLKPGEIRWVPRGLIHTTTNVGASPATFITLEFD
jgi:quercetin dioxygenase-like cupin family protein